MIAVYISDARDEYARTIFEKVALPAGAHVTVRYSLKRIQPPLRDVISNNRVNGKEVLFCYLEGNKGNLNDAKATATRYAFVVKSERIADFVSIECKLQGFPSSPRLADLFSTADGAGILSPGPRLGLFVVNVSSPSDEQFDNGQPDRWSEIVQELTRYSFFGSASFVYCESIVDKKGRRAVCQEGVFRVQPGQSMVCRIHTLAVTRESRLHQYEIRTDDNILELARDEDISLAFGREFFDLRFTALLGDRTRHTRLRFDPRPGEDGAFFSIPIEIPMRRFANVLRRTAFAVSGAAAATAGVLPDATPLALRIALVAAGSVGMALNTRRPS